MKLTLRFISLIPSDTKGDTLIIKSDKDQNSLILFDNLRYSELPLEVDAYSIDFPDIFEKNSIDINNYYFIDKYKVSKSGLSILKREAIKHKNLTIIDYTEGKSSVLKMKTQLNDDGGIEIYEYAGKNNPNDLVMVIDPELVNNSLEIMMGLTKYQYEFDINTEAGIDYLTKESNFILNKDELKDICYNLLNNQVPEELKNIINDFNPMEMVAMWDSHSISGRNPEVDFRKLPWKAKMNDIKEKSLKIIKDNRYCPYMKLKVLKYLINRK